jgi:hypothetical protein
MTNEILLSVDLSEKEISFGRFKYDIVQADEKYITGYGRSDHFNPGGEVIVIDRITGVFERSAVYIAATLETLANSKSAGALTAKSFSGTCANRVF